MDKKIIRLTESDIHKIVKESVEKVRRLYESDDELEMGTDEEFDAFMQWATTDGSDMFSSAANEYVNNGDESKLYVLSTYYAREVGLNQNVAFNIAKEAAEGIYGFLGGMQVVDTRNANEAISRSMSKKLVRLTESDLHRIVKESVHRILKEHKWDADAWEMPADEYETNPFNGRTEGEFNFIDKTKKMNNRTNANVAQKIHPQTNSNYGSSKVLGHDYNTPEGRKELEKWTNLDKSVYKI